MQKVLFIPQRMEVSNVIKHRISATRIHIFVRPQKPSIIPAMLTSRDDTTSRLDMIIIPCIQPFYIHKPATNLAERSASL